MELAIVVVGFAVGIVVGRWWAVAAAVALGAWIALSTDVEVSPVFLGSGYAVLAAIGIGGGVLVRRRARAHSAQAAAEIVSRDGAGGVVSCRLRKPVTQRDAERPSAPSAAASHIRTSTGLPRHYCFCCSYA